MTVCLDNLVHLATLQQFREGVPWESLDANQKKMKAHNYRRFNLLSIFGKLLLGIFLNRLNQMVEEFNIVRENQIAYRKSSNLRSHFYTSCHD